MENTKKFETLLQLLDGMESENLMKIVEKFLSDDDIELFVDHLESFYGVTDDDELGMLAQIMITGFLCAKAESSELDLDALKN
jgi:hypothetical protein